MDYFRVSTDAIAMFKPSATGMKAIRKVGAVSNPRRESSALRLVFGLA